MSVRPATGVTLRYGGRAPGECLQAPQAAAGLGSWLRTGRETPRLNHDPVTSERLRREAAARGVMACYRDSRGRRTEVPDATLAAILDALGPLPGPVPRRRAGGWPSPGEPSDHPVAPRPARRSWGFTVQLYALRSRRSWGHGDLADLAELAAWSARALGAGFVLVNPLHAAEPAPPVSPSPYLPMTRRYLSPLYLRVENVPGYESLPGRRQIEDLAAPLRAASASPALIDRDRAWRAKRAALELLHARPMDAARRAAFGRFRLAEGQALEDWATWCALAEIHGPDWRAWPPPLRDPRSAATAAERARLAGRVRFHAWLQWLAAGQLAAAQAAARAAGMAIGVIGDLAVGSHPGGADAWAHQELLVPGMSVGAPPDEFNQRGQDWSQPPWHPGRLAAAGHRPLAELAGAGFAHTGGLRADHVMGLFRLWWIPAGMPPGQGAYVRYQHEATVGALAGAAARAGGLAIGEDLGTVEPWIRGYLARRGILGTSMLWFERDPGGRPLPPARWRRWCLATVGTHDVPPARAFLTGEQVTLRARLGLLTRDPDTERRAAAAALAAWRSALVSEGILAAGARPGPAALTAALYAYLARTPAALIGVSLADAVGERQPQNLPGTTTEYPNWRLPLCDAEGSPVLLEDLPGYPGVAEVARAASGQGLACGRG
jgi:4-alpha-glucanotransferase